MPLRSAIVGFSWRFALVYGLLIAPWPGFNAAYGKYFRGLGQMTFAREGERRILYFEAVPAELHRVLDTRIALANRDQLDREGKGPVHYLELDTRGIGWVPTALLLALILATPVPWWRRGWALLWGLLAIHGYILLCVAVYIWTNSTDLLLLTLSPFWKNMANGLEETLITQMGASFIIPVLIWILITIQMRDVIAWQSKAS